MFLQDPEICKTPGSLRLSWPINNSIKRSWGQGILGTGRTKIFLVTSGPQSVSFVTGYVFLSR